MTVNLDGRRDDTLGQFDIVLCDLVVFDLSALCGSTRTAGPTDRIDFSALSRIP